MGEHTPGPWGLVQIDDDPDIWIVCDNGGEPPSRAVAHDVFNQADASLIAAAPDLLAFAEGIATTLEDPRFPPDAEVWDVVQSQAQALVTKARTGNGGSARG